MRYLILGVTEARDETGAPLPIGGARLRALLAALALRAGRPASVAELVDDVWGDDPPRDAPAALQALVARLRRALGGHDTVHAAPTGGYRLEAAHDDVDLHRFGRLAAQGSGQLAADPAAAARTLRTALRLWRGPALADLPEPARTAHAAAPEARRRSALRGRIEADLRSGATAPAELLPEIEALIHESPYDEPLRAQHLRALRAAGRPADALAAYEHTRRTLADGLGTDPGPELTALHAELLRQPRPSPPPHPPTATPTPTQPPPPTPELHPYADAPSGNLRPRLNSFVGREPELDALWRDLTRLRLVTLTGPGGSGKTRLAEHAAAAHPRPARLVELARLDHPAAVPGAVLSALAAARLRLLTPRQIADRLDDRFRLLTSGARTVLPRQQTLRAVVDWSWDLLDEAERTLLRRLSVFAGGCDLAAAEAVCGDADAAPSGMDVADTLGSLVDKSLVVAAPGPDGMRYRMLETIHEYAAERADAHPADARATARRHAAHFLAFAERAEPLIRSAAQLPWIRLVETELDNLRTALHTTTVDDPHPDPAPDPDRGTRTETAQRLAFALGWFWWLRNYRGEGAEWTTRILALTPAPPPEGTPAHWRYMRLQVLNMFLLAESNSAEKFRTPEYRDLAVRIKAAFRHGSPQTTVFPGLLWPATSFLTGDVLDFHTDLDQSVENCRRHAGDWELGVVLMLRTHVAIDLTGGLPTVDADLAELHEIAQRVGDRWTRAQVASAAGEIALSRGRYADARTEFQECLRLAREVGAHVEAPFALARIAEVAYSAGDLDDAERLLTEADEESEQHGGVYDVSAYARLLAAMLALQRGDAARARTECELARAQTERITVPAQLTAGLDTVDAHLTAREQGPAAALSLIGPALSAAVTARCAERVLAGMAEAAARFLADAGRPAASVRAFAAATAWRAGLPRSVPEATVVDGLPERTRALLGPDRWAREEAAGAVLTPADLAAALTADRSREPGHRN
ncbi:AfsR/SARP family transcriptional regulator [Streptomyces sp. NRRL F-2664]|uniref:AfsR/SARP family transcriptional regulator n=1 Tax=Streptomyces sp. NRRL F-2664 TaxID=1463842 RepID=UPI0004C596CC|nr:BTAD domain-containing putative transcriptional regulator [Streptomyces sp. NRRL F-2664]